jgi:hypothetical protein
MLFPLKIKQNKDTNQLQLSDIISFREMRGLKTGEHGLKAYGWKLNPRGVLSVFFLILHEMMGISIICIQHPC